MSVKICSVPECLKASRWRGMCGGHYTRLRRHGDPNYGGKLGNRADNGVPMQYLLAHMNDDCPKWPFSRNASGYGKINIGGRPRLVHRLVCEMVYGSAPTKRHHAAHSCGKGHEGCFGAACLSWKTPSDNRADMVVHGTIMRGEQHPNAKLRIVEVMAIRELAASGENQDAIARRFGIVQSAVANIKSGRRWASR